MYSSPPFKEEQEPEHADPTYTTLRRSPDRSVAREKRAEMQSLGMLVSPGRDLNEQYQQVGNSKGLHWKRHPIRGGNTKYPGGYTGWVAQPPAEPHVLDTKFDRIAIRGYTGFRPNQGTVVGVPIIPSVEEQEGRERNLLGPNESCPTSKPKRGVSQSANFRQASKNMDLLERYTTARMTIIERGQTQAYLLAQVQAKLSSKVNSYAEQQIHLRKLFEAFDWNQDGVLDEFEFRACMERINIQFDDFQTLALFAYFDSDNDGLISWGQFADSAMVPNPRGGTAILPNPIVQVTFR